MPDGLNVSDLAKSYGDVEALAGVSFTVAQGEIFGLLGKNGAGKTTAIECIVGLKTPDSGTIHICGVDAVSHREQSRLLIGVQLQSTALQDKITPREALKLFAAFYARPANVESLIDWFELGEKADATFDTLSGGQRQRLALALAMVNRPKVLFLDEPTAGLDAQSRRELHQTILRMRQDGCAVVLTTHYIEEAHELCDRLAIIDRGRIVAEGTPRQLIARGGQMSRVDVRTENPLEATSLQAIGGVRDVQKIGEGWSLKTESVAQTVTELVRRLEGQGNQLLDLHVHGPSLEDVFIELTGGNR